MIPSIETDLQVVHGLAAELRDIAHEGKHRDGLVKFTGSRWLEYYHSLDRILMEHDRRQAEMHKAADEIERLRKERDEARREAMLLLSERSSVKEMNAEYKKRGWEYLKENTDYLQDLG